MTAYKVTWTCTSGRRPNYFRMMVNSFLETCLDRDLIVRWICVDDRSSIDDLNRLKSEFPFIEFISNDGKGQLNSLRKIASLVETEWIFHTEDDWVFNPREEYIRQCFRIIESDCRIRQVTLRGWDTMYVKHRLLEYGMHCFSPLEVFNWDIVRRNDQDYPGLTFNPSLVSTDIFKECVSFGIQENPENRGWDKVVARRYWDLGLRRANLIGDYICHIGRESFYNKNK